MYTKEYLSYITSYEESYLKALETNENKSLLILENYSVFLREKIDLLYFDDYFLDFFSLLYFLQFTNLKPAEYLNISKLYIFNYNIKKLFLLADRFFYNLPVKVLISNISIPFVLKDFLINLVLIKGYSLLINILSNISILDYYYTNSGKNLNLDDYKKYATELANTDIYSDEYMLELKNSIKRIKKNTFNYYLFQQ